MKLSLKSGLVLAALAAALTACSNDQTAVTKSGEPSATASAAASASPPAASSSVPSASPTDAQYTLDVQADGFEKPPEGTSLEPVAEDSAIYVPSDSKDAKVHLAFDMDVKGDFTLAEGAGTLMIGGNSLPFEINQVSVMHEEKLSSGQTLYFGGLQVDAKSDPTTFAFGFRFIPEAKELQLRLSNGEGLVVFGGGDTITKNEAEIEQLEEGHRPKN